MKNAFLVGVLSLFLMACSSPTPIKPQVNSLPKIEPKSEILPKSITTNSHVLAEPLPNKKVRIRILAKDKDLIITNCNGDFAYSLVPIDGSQEGWSSINTMCLSANIVIPKGMSLTVERQFTEDFYPLNMNKMYRLKVNDLNYIKPIYDDKPMPDTDIMSNPFKLIP